MPALFKRLRGDGISTLLATSAKADELKQYKKIVGIEDLTTADVSSEDAENSKPDPDIFHAALEKLPGVELRDIVVIGDTPHDSTAAKKAGLRTIGVRCGGVPDADRGYSSYAFREHIWTLGARLVIPTRRNDKTLSCSSWIYTNRNQVERL